MELSPGLIALIGTIFGGVGLKITESWLTKSARKSDDAKEIRDELRLTISAQKQEIVELEKLVDRWRTDYYTVREEKIKVDTENQILKAQLRKE